MKHVLDSIVVSIPACHVGDRGSIPSRGGCFKTFLPVIIKVGCDYNGFGYSYFPRSLKPTMYGCRLLEQQIC